MTSLDLNAASHLSLVCETRSAAGELEDEPIALTDSENKSVTTINKRRLVFMTLAT